MIPYMNQEYCKISCLVLIDKDVGIHFCFSIPNILQHIVQEEIVL